MFHIDDCVGFITNRASKQIAETFNKKLSKYGITRVQWIALFILGKYDYINQSELSEKMNIKKSTTVSLIDRMEKEGYIIREKDKKDRRIIYVRLTDIGKKCREELIPFGEDFSKLIVRDISDNDIEIFKKVLDQLVKNSQIDD